MGLRVSVRRRDKQLSIACACTSVTASASLAASPRRASYIILSESPRRVLVCTSPMHLHVPVVDNNFGLERLHVFPRRTGQYTLHYTSLQLQRSLRGDDTITCSTQRNDEMLLTLIEYTSRFAAAHLVYTTNTILPKVLAAAPTLHGLTILYLMVSSYAPLRGDFTLEYLPSLPPSLHVCILYFTLPRLGLKIPAACGWGDTINYTSHAEI